MFRSSKGAGRSIIFGIVGLILIISLLDRSTTQTPNINENLNDNLVNEQVDKENESSNDIEEISIQKDEYDYETEIKNLSIPAYSSEAYVVINNNEPFFNESDLTDNSYEKYSSLDFLGRCGYAIASVGKDIMPTEERGNIGMIKPTGWHSVRYQGVDGNYLYNRCHLLGFQLTGENANEKNLITGTRYMNVEGMLPFENMVADYVKETNNHVLLRVTPIFEGANLLASGVLMEAKSVEDDGEGVLFNVYCYNVQPNVTITYLTGESTGPEYTGNTTSQTTTKPQENAQIQTPITSENKIEANYILNTNTKKFHYPTCSSVKQMSKKNKESFNGTRDDVINSGYKPCGNCNP